MIGIFEEAERYKRITKDLFKSDRTGHFDEDYETHGGAPEEDLGWPVTLQNSGLVTSAVYRTNPHLKEGEGKPEDLISGEYKLVVDLDVDAVLTPSAKKGHWHLIIDKKITKDQHDKILRALAEAEIVEQGYAEVSAKRIFGACVRPPHKPKDIGFVYGSKEYDRRLKIVSVWRKALFG